MTLVDYVIIVAIGLLSAVGQYLLKIGAGTVFEGPAGIGPIGVITRALTTPSLLFASATYAFALAIYLFVLAKADVSQIFPAAIGVNILCVVLMAAVVLGESVTFPRLLGMAAIAIGVYVVTQF